MKTKLDAAKICQDSGIAVAICSAYEKDVLKRIVLKQEDVGTAFVPKKRLRSSKRWIAYGAHSQGCLYVDNGARKALVEANKSLLYPGIKKIEGDFDSGDIVDICDMEGVVFAKGKVSCSAHFLKRAKKVKKEIVHRNNMVLLQ